MKRLSFIFLEYGFRHIPRKLIVFILFLGYIRSFLILIVTPFPWYKYFINQSLWLWNSIKNVFIKLWTVIDVYIIIFLHDCWSFFFIKLIMHKLIGLPCQNLYIWPCIILIGKEDTFSSSQADKFTLNQFQQHFIHLPATLCEQFSEDSSKYFTFKIIGATNISDLKWYCTQSVSCIIYH